MPTTRTAPVALARLIADLIRASGDTKKAFGSSVGLNASTVSHLLSGDPHYVLGTEACLRIAHHTGASASQVLRAAGKADIADLIEALYGPAARRVPTRYAGWQKRAIEELGRLDATARKAILTLITHMRAHDDGGAQARRRRLLKSEVRKKTA